MNMKYYIRMYKSKLTKNVIESKVVEICWPIFLFNPFHAAFQLKSLYICRVTYLLLLESHRQH
jgi:hypothetical protein